MSFKTLRSAGLGVLGATPEARKDAGVHMFLALEHARTVSVKISLGSVTPSRTADLDMVCSRTLRLELGGGRHSDLAKAPN